MGKQGGDKVLRLSWFEFFIRAIPEEFLFVLAIHGFTKTRINLNKYLLSAVIVAIMTYLIRLLPIQYGIHSLLGLIMVVVVVSYINKVDIIQSIRAGIITFILCFICEGINLFFLQFALKIDLNMLITNPILKTLWGLPSLILFGVIVIIYYNRLLKRKEL